MCGMMRVSLGMEWPSTWGDKLPLVVLSSYEHRSILLQLEILKYAFEFETASSLILSTKTQTLRPTPLSYLRIVECSMHKIERQDVGHSLHCVHCCIRVRESRSLRHCHLSVCAQHSVNLGTNLVLKAGSCFVKIF